MVVDERCQASLAQALGACIQHLEVAKKPDGHADPHSYHSIQHVDKGKAHPFRDISGCLGYYSFRAQCPKERESCMCSVNHIAV